MEVPAPTAAAPREWRQRLTAAVATAVLVAAWRRVAPQRGEATDGKSEAEEARHQAREASHSPTVYSPDSFRRQAGTP